MPIEIRELVIQAQVRENADPANETVVQARNAMDRLDGSGTVESDGKLSPEYLDFIVETCMARMKEWMIEKSMR